MKNQIEKITEFPVIYDDSTIVDILYMDFTNESDNKQPANVPDIAKFDGDENRITITPLVKNVQLEMVSKSFLVKENIAQKLSEHLITEIIYEDDNKLNTKLNLYSFKIAQECRIGKPNIITMNFETYLKHQDVYKEFSNNNAIKISINEYLSDDMVYLIRKSRNDEPGYKIIYNENSENCYAFVGIGWNPEFTICTLKITYEN